MDAECALTGQMYLRLSSRCLEGEPGSRRRYGGAMITRLDHIAIAVPDLEAAIRRFCEDMGLELAGREDVPSPPRPRRPSYPSKAPGLSWCIRSTAKGPFRNTSTSAVVGCTTSASRPTTSRLTWSDSETWGYRLLSDTPQPAPTAPASYSSTQNPAVACSSSSPSTPGPRRGTDHVAECTGATSAGRRDHLWPTASDELGSAL